MTTSSCSLIDAYITTSPSEGDSSAPRQQWIDVSFPAAPVVISHISFSNYYTSAITISHTGTRADSDPLTATHMKGRTPTWQVAVPKLTLMSDPHCEDDAQCYHELTVAHFAPDFDYRRVTRLRICCLQPSPLWREYGIQQLRFYATEVSAVPTLQPPPSLTIAERDMALIVVEQLVELGSIAEQIRSTIHGGATAASAVRSKSMRGAGSGRAGAGAGRSNGLSGGGTSSGEEFWRAESVVAPYLLGEWSDELRLLSSDALSSASLASSGKLSGVGGSHHPRSGTRPQSAANAR